MKTSIAKLTDNNVVEYEQAPEASAVYIIKDGAVVGQHVHDGETKLYVNLDEALYIMIDTND